MHRARLPGAVRHGHVVATVDPTTPCAWPMPSSWSSSGRHSPVVTGRDESAVGVEGEVRQSSGLAAAAVLPGDQLRRGRCPVERDEGVAELARGRRRSALRRRSGPAAGSGTPTRDPDGQRASPRARARCRRRGRRRARPRWRRRAATDRTSEPAGVDLERLDADVAVDGARHDQQHVAVAAGARSTKVSRRPCRSAGSPTRPWRTTWTRPAVDRARRLGVGRVGGRGDALRPPAASYVGPRGPR